MLAKRLHYVLSTDLAARRLPQVESHTTRPERGQLTEGSLRLFRKAPYREVCTTSRSWSACEGRCRMQEGIYSADLQCASAGRISGDVRNDVGCAITDEVASASGSMLICLKRRRPDL